MNWLGRLCWRHAEWEAAVTKKDITDEALRAIRRIFRKTADHSRRLQRDSGLTMPQVLCLRFLAEADPGEEITVAKISEGLQLAPATVSRLLDRLEDAGLLVRERRSRDRRKVCLSLTNLGRKQVEKLPTPLQEQFARRLQALPHDEQRRLLDALEKVVEMMEASQLDAAPVLEAGEEPPVD